MSQVNVRIPPRVPKPKAAGLILPRRFVRRLLVP